MIIIGPWVTPPRNLVYIPELGNIRCLWEVLFAEDPWDSQCGRVVQGGIRSFNVIGRLGLAPRSFTGIIFVLLQAMWSSSYYLRCCTLLVQKTIWAIIKLSFYLAFPCGLVERCFLDIPWGFAELVGFGLSTPFRFALDLAVTLSESVEVISVGPLAQLRSGRSSHLLLRWGYASSLG